MVKVKFKLSLPLRDEGQRSVRSTAAASDKCGKTKQVKRIWVLKAKG